MPLTLTRSLLVVLVPGLVGSAPWLLLAAQLWPDLKTTYANYTVPANAILFALIVVVGGVFEGLAPELEVRWDKRLECDFNVRESWYAYLARVGAEPVGHRYVSRMVTTLYFELTMLCASFAFFVGAAALVLRSNAHRPVRYSLLMCAAAVGFAAYFRWQGRATHTVLCEVRRELVARVPVVAGEAKAAPAREVGAEE